MEIINTTLVEVGNKGIDWMFLIFIGGLGLLSIICAIMAFADRESAPGLVALLFGIFAIGISINIFLAKRITQPYNRYDVIFTGEEINMKEFLDKYTITGNDGNIYHIEDKH